MKIPIHVSFNHIKLLKQERGQGEQTVFDIWELMKCIQSVFSFPRKKEHIHCISRTRLQIPCTAIMRLYQQGIVALTAVQPSCTLLMYSRTLAFEYPYT